MYVDPAVRGRGLSRPILERVERTAREAGVETLMLNTGPEQRAAIALYESAGYRPSEPFGHYACVGDALFLAKSLPMSPHDGGPIRNAEGPSIR